MSKFNRCFDLTVLPGPLAIVRLAADAALPDWATRDDFFSVTRAGEELSIICRADRIPNGVSAEKEWRALKVKGPFALSEVGVLAGLAATLAEAKVSLFAISTFDTDYLLVSERQLSAAVAALRSAGHCVEELNAGA